MMSTLVGRKLNLVRATTKKTIRQYSSFLEWKTENVLYVKKELKILNSMDLNLVEWTRLYLSDSLCLCNRGL